MEQSSIHKLLNLCTTAFEQLGISAEPIQTEHLAVRIHRTMSLQSRCFHTAQHVVDLSDPANPIQTLAALFHDVVYYQVDRGFAPDIAPLLDPLITDDNGAVRIADSYPVSEKNFRTALDVFGFKPGQPLSPFGGLNEFLSSLVMILELQKFLNDKDLLSILVCIEATIPFRDKNSAGQSWGDMMSERLQIMTENINALAGPGDIPDMIRNAIILSNKDVGSFGEHDAASFLDSTWKLLPETNISLRRAEDYTIKDYRTSIQKMEGFFSFLNPELIFRQYHDTPPADVFEQMKNRAKNNIMIARDYLGVKLVSMAVLEALADLSGGDAPMSLFTGDHSSNGRITRRLEYFLPAHKLKTKNDPKSTVYRILSRGRLSDVSFDVKNSPISAYLFECIGFDHIMVQLPKAKDYFAEKISAAEYISLFDKQVISPIAKACSAMVPTRRETLSRFIKY